MAATRQPLRILALPISLHHSKPIYCFHPLLSRVSKASSDSPQSSSSSSPISSAPSPWSSQRFQLTTALPRLVDWSSHKWDELSSSEPGTLKYRIWAYGEKLMNRIEFEEWSLKAIDPNSLHPKPFRRKEEVTNEKTDEQERQQPEQNDTVPLYYPSSIVNTPSSMLQYFNESLTIKTPHHFRRIFICLGATPLTIPFMIIPIIPNLPFFFLVWRAWSHWRAWKTSKYLLELHQRQLLIPTPSPLLDVAYQQQNQSNEKDTIKPSSSSPSSSSSSTSSSSPLLLNLHGVENIVKSFELSDRCKHDLHRTVTQSKARLEED